MSVEEMGSALAQLHKADWFTTIQVTATLDQIAFILSAWKYSGGNRARIVHEDHDLARGLNSLLEDVRKHDHQQA